VQNRSKPNTKLTVLFILAVIIPGGILTYLSIQNLSNLRELTEKKIQEEEKELSDSICHKFLSILNTATEDFNDLFSDINTQNKLHINSESMPDYAKNPFITDINGDFLIPNFIDDFLISNKFIYSERFNNNYRAGENNFYMVQNYSRAEQSYLTALNIARAGPDSAKAINALARLSAKRRDISKTIHYYSLLSSEYYDMLDDNGYPYVYYSIPQLLNISDSQQTNIIFEEFNLILSKIVSGEIPLVHNTYDLIDSIADWTNRDSSGIDNNKQEIDRNIKEIKNQLNFILQFSGNIRDYINNKENGNFFTVNEYFPVSTLSDNGERLILIKSYKNNHIIGFEVILDDIKNILAGEDLNLSNEFEYNLEIVKSNNDLIQESTGQVRKSKLSSFTPNEYIVVRLKNENLIDEFVTRRSWLYAIALILLIGGLILGVYLILRDLSREKYLSQIRSDFISNVTHELKTPLTSIHMFAESILLGRIKKKKDQKEYLGIIIKETERLKRLINTVLSFSRMEKDKLEYNFKEVNISDLVRSALKELDYWIVERKFFVESDIQDGIVMEADPDALKQAVLNLISNAIKYSYDVKEIFVGLRKTNNNIYIEVKDKGVGIPEDQTDLIFDKYYRLEPGNVIDSSGTGLGLTVTKNIVEAHNGKIIVKSKVNYGSIFTIILKSDFNFHNDHFC